MRRALIATVVLTALALSTALLAQDKKPAGPPESVADMINAGLQLKQAGKTADAAAKFQEAVTAATKMVEDGTADASIYLNLGAAYFNLEDHPKAIESYERAAVMDPTSAMPYEGLAAIYHAVGDEEKALDALSKAAIADPTKNEQYFNAVFDDGKALFDKHEYEKAEPYLRRAVEVNPEDLPANLGIAQCLEFQKKYADAIPFFQKVLALNKEDFKKAAFMMKVAKCQYFGKAYTDAVITSEKVLEIRPNEETALLFRAGSFLELKDCAKAIPAVDSFLAISKNDSARLPMLKGMGKCQYDLKKWRDAAATYEKVLAIDGSDEDALLYAGNSYVQLKSNSKALACFRKLVQVTKDSGLKASAQKSVRQLGG